jgi:hypothetical protein
MDIKTSFFDVIVLDPGKGGCTDPVNKGAILREGSQEPTAGDKEGQLSPDKGRERT